MRRQTLVSSLSALGISFLLHCLVILALPETEAGQRPASTSLRVSLRQGGSGGTPGVEGVSAKEAAGRPVSAEKRSPVRDEGLIKPSTKETEVAKPSLSHASDAEAREAETQESQTDALPGPGPLGGDGGAVASGGGGDGSEPGAGSGRGGSFDSGLYEKSLGLYRDQLFEKINRAKRYPTSAQRLNQEGRVRVSFRLGKDGRLLDDPRILEQSRFKVLDKAALDAVRGIKDFPPFPNEINDESFEFIVYLDFSLR